MRDFDALFADRRLELPMSKHRVVLLVFLLLLSRVTRGEAQSGDPFSFESIASLDDMRSYIRGHFQLGSRRDDLRRTFVVEGHATPKDRPDDPGVEKYIYDIDLCHYYIWRWNISADFDADGKLRQVYVNGDPTLEGGTPKKVIPKVAEEGKKASIYHVQRPRPEAFKGEKSLGFLLFDRDSDLNTTHDQAAVGAGPSRPNPVDMGKMYVYADVDPWRSIFDADAADTIVPFAGDCVAADELYERQKRQCRPAPRTEKTERGTRGANIRPP